MKHFIKAAMTAGALLASSQAFAGDFILGYSPNFVTKDVTSTSITASLNNVYPSGSAGFTDNFYFAIPTTWAAAVGNGTAASSNFKLTGNLGLDFLNPGGLVINAYKLTGAAYTALTTGNAAAIAAIAASSVVEYTQDGDYGRLGNNAIVGLSDVPLSPDLFYVITFKGKSTNGGNYDGNLRAEVTVAVPEPATWAMLLAGFGAVGFAMRRRRTSHAVKVSFG